MKRGDSNFENFEMLLGHSDVEMNKLKRLLPMGGKNLKNIKGEHFPEDFVFRQNEYRCEDLEVEERALMNITA